MPFDFPGFAYAAAVAAGGIIGYVKSNSIPSLGAGLLFGCTLGYGALLTSRDFHNYGLILGTNVVLGGMMGYRFYSTNKIMPAGIIAVTSTIMAIRYAMRMFFSSPVKMQ